MGWKDKTEMSVEAITWALGIKTGSPTRKVVLLCLANYADREGVCWPSYESLAEQCEISKNTIIRCIAALVDGGLLTREVRHTKNGKQTSNSYTLAMPMRQGYQVGTLPYPELWVPPLPIAMGTTYEPSLEPPLNIELGADAPSGPKKEVLKKAEKKGTRLVNDWQPSQSTIDTVYEWGLIGDEVNWEHDRFSDYWLAKTGSGSTKLDWDRTWLNWMRRVLDQKQEKLRREKVYQERFKK